MPRFACLQDVPAKWRRRSLEERVFLLEAFLLLGIARLAVLFLPFRWIASTLGSHMKETDDRIDPANLETAQKIGQAIRSAANYTPWKSVCLPQAVTGQWMLRRHGIAGTLYLGVAKDEDGSGELAAHAWLRCGPIVMTGDKGRQRYTVVGYFGRKGR